MRRNTIGIVVALAMIAGWFLRIAAEKFPDWNGLAVPVSGLTLGILIEVLDRRISNAIRDSKTHSDGES